jgi:isopenicillin N synthase-like dioxygenase
MATTTTKHNGRIQIPVINLARTSSSGELAIAEELVKAAAVHGFVYVKNLGEHISVQEIDRVFVLVGTPEQSVIAE